jgi:uncharacterized phage protein (TIGR02216 family)
MGIGFGLLRLSPRDFWAMTPRELAAAVRPLTPRTTPPDRAAIEALMRRFPDH